jgi:hypothetical protein
MTDLLEEIKRLQGLEEKKKRNLLPRAVLVAATVALVVVMTIRFQYKYERTEREDALHLQPAVLIKKLAEAPVEAPVAVRATEGSDLNAAGRPEATAAATAAGSEGSTRVDAFRSGPPEQPDLEKAIEMVMKRRSPKY